MRWREVTVLGACYRSWTTRRGNGGGGRPEVSAVSKAFVSKSKRRGRGVGRVLRDEGNGGGMGSALPPLPPGTGGRPTAVQGMAAHQIAAVAASRGGHGPRCCCGLGRHRRMPKKNELGCQGSLGRKGNWAARIEFKF
jgi:hypothetical protein